MDLAWSAWNDFQDCVDFLQVDLLGEDDEITLMAIAMDGRIPPTIFPRHNPLDVAMTEMCFR